MFPRRWILRVDSKNDVLGNNDVSFKTWPFWVSNEKKLGGCTPKMINSKKLGGKSSPIFSTKEKNDNSPRFHSRHHKLT